MFMPLRGNRRIEPRRSSARDGFRMRSDRRYAEEERPVRRFDGIVKEADSSG